MISSLLDEAEARYGNHYAVRDGTGRWTYHELACASRKVAQGLTHRNIGPKDRVLSLLPGGREFAALLFGALRRGAVVIPVAEDISDYQLSALLLDARPTIVVAPESSKDVSGVPITAVRSLLDEKELAESWPMSPDDPALIIYTSGSTGQPRGIVCPHSAVVWVSRAIARAIGYRDTDVIYVRLPISFDYGLYQILLAVLAGAEAVFPWGPLSADELNVVRACGASVIPVVPTLAGMLSALAARDDRPTSVRLLTNTGAALVGQGAEQLRAAFPNAELICMYGMSECKRITIASPDEDLEFPDTVGRALPGTRLSVVNSVGQEVPTGELGEIVSAGPHVMAGYWRAPAAESEVFMPALDVAGMAVRTGDYGYLDNEGRLYFVGRRDDIFKRRGWRTSSAEIERAMLDVSGVRQAACFPPRSDGLLIVWAVTEHSPSQILQEIRSRLGPAKVPDKCVVVERLPQTRNGKIDKHALLTSLDGTG